MLSQLFGIKLFLTSVKLLYLASKNLNHLRLTKGMPPYTGFALGVSGSENLRKLQLHYHLYLIKILTQYFKPKTMTDLLSILEIFEYLAIWKKLIFEEMVK
jgi:hypothetical protein